MILRQSVLASYEKCPFMCLKTWGDLNAHDGRFENNDDKGNKYSLEGIAFHKTMQFWGDEKITGRTAELDELGNIFKDEFVKIPRNQFTSADEIRVDYLALRNQIKWVYDNHCFATPIAVEKDFVVKIAADLPMFSGTIDRIDNSDGLHVIDYKTGKKYTKKELKDNIQAGTYAIACRELYGEYPVDISFIFSKEQKVKTIKVTEQFITDSLSRIRQSYYKIVNNQYPPNYRIGSFFCDHFCICKSECPRYSVKKSSDIMFNDVSKGA